MKELRRVHEDIWRKCEETMKKYVGNMKKYMENKKDSLYISAVGLGKIPIPSPYLWAGGEIGS